MTLIYHVQYKHKDDKHYTGRGSYFFNEDDAKEDALRAKTQNMYHATDVDVRVTKHYVK